MIAVIQRIPRDEAEALISSTIRGNLKDNEIEIYNRCIRRTAPIYIGIIHGEIVCMYGLMVESLMSGQGYLWLYTTDALAGNEFVFIRQSQIGIEKMLAECSEIHGHTKISERQSMRWLKFLGAKFDEPEQGLAHFVIRRR